MTSAPPKTAFKAAHHLQIRRRRAAGPGEPGFTLVELVTTVAIAAILTTIAIPNFFDLVLANKLSAASNDLILAIGTARMEAIKRNTTISVCSDSSCAVKTATSTKIFDGIPGITDPVQIQSVKPLIYNGQGLGRASSGAAPYSGLVADIFTTRLSADNHRCIYMSTGSVVRSCTITGNCPSAEPTSCRD